MRILLVLMVVILTSCSYDRYEITQYHKMLGTHTYNMNKIALGFDKTIHPSDTCRFRLVTVVSSKGTGEILHNSNVPCNFGNIIEEHKLAEKFKRKLTEFDFLIEKLNNN